MAWTTFSIFSNVFGFVVAVISLLALLFNICRSHFPGNKIEELEELMQETQALFDGFVDNDLLIEPDFVRQTRRHLGILRTTCRLRRRLRRTTALRQILEFLRGTSSEIEDTCHSLELLKAEVITSSEQGRAVPERNSVRTSTSLPVLPALPPPVYLGGLGRGLGDGKHGFAQGNGPSCDSTRRDLDVRTIDGQY